MTMRLLPRWSNAEDFPACHFSYCLIGAMAAQFSHTPNSLGTHSPGTLANSRDTTWKPPRPRASRRCCRSRKRVGDQVVVQGLVAPAIENQSAPVGVAPTARVGMLVQMRAIEFTQAVSLGNEQESIRQHAKPRLMETGRCGNVVSHRTSITAGGGKISSVW